MHSGQDFLRGTIVGTALLRYNLIYFKLNVQYIHVYNYTTATTKI